MGKKAFIFDMDGVLIDNEALWEEWKDLNYPKIYGREVAEKLGQTVGKSIDDVYEIAVGYGSKVDKSTALAAFEIAAHDIYLHSQITPGLEKLGVVLDELNFSIGVVSASPLEWINLVVGRLPFRQNVQVIISLHERADLSHKPAPDGYNEAIRKLGAVPETTLILEDANRGIASAKASGAKVIGLKQNLLKDYEQKGADIYADTIEEVITLAKAFSHEIMT